MTKTIPQSIVIRPEGDKRFGVYCQELRLLTTLPNMDTAGEMATAIAESFGIGVATLETSKGGTTNVQKIQQSPPPAATTVSPRTRVTGVADKIRELIKAGKEDGEIITAVLPMYTAAGKRAEDVIPTLKSYIKEVRGMEKG